MESELDNEPYKSMPGNELDQPGSNIKETLHQVNANMGTMTFLLQQLVESSINWPTGLMPFISTRQNIEIPTGKSAEGSTGSDGHFPIGHIESTRQTLPTTANDSLSPMPGLSNVKKRAASNELPTPAPPAKTSREDHDTISIYADENIEQDEFTNKSFLDEITEGFENSDDVSENISKKLAIFVENRWGQQLKSEKSDN